MPRLTPPPDLVDSPLAVRKSMLRKSRSPWLIVLFGGIIALAVVLLLGVVLNLIGEEASVPDFEHQVTMPDGTILVVEGVTWGLTHEVPMSHMPQSGFFRGYVNNRVYHSTSEDRLVVFMRRIDARTGQTLDFTWWGSSAAVDANGVETPDSNPYQQMVHSYGSWSHGGYRPLSAPESSGYFDRRDPRSVIVAHSEFPAIRVDGDTFHLIVRDTNNQVVAEFDLPYPGPTAGAAWTPEPLPASQTVDGFTLTLTDVNVVVQQFQYDLEVKGQLSYEGVDLGDAYPTIISLSDPLGNNSYGYGVDLSWGEPAWKVRISAYNSNWPAIPIEPDETAEIGTFTLPAAGTTVAISSSPVVHGQQVAWHSIGGPNATHDLGYTGTGYGSYPQGFYVGEEYVEFTYEDPSYGLRQVTSGSSNAYLLVGTDPSYGYYYSSAELVTFATPDGVEILSNVTTVSDVVVAAFIPPEGVTEVVATYVVRRPLPEFEFLIAPPDDRPPLPVPVAPPGGHGMSTPYSYSSHAIPYATPSMPMMDQMITPDPSLPAVEAVPEEEPMPQGEPMPEGDAATIDDASATEEESTAEETPPSEVDAADEASEPQ